MTVTFELYSSSFCGACHETRAVLSETLRLVPGTRIAEHDIAMQPELAEQEGIASTPTVIVRGDDGAEVFRASGVPTLQQVLAAAALTR